VGVPADHNPLRVVFEGRDSGQSDVVVLSQPQPRLTAPSQPYKPTSGRRLWFHIKRNLIPHDIVTSSTQLVRHRLDGHHTVSLGLLSLVETLDPGVVPDGKVGRLHKCPGQILIPVLGIALALFLAVADLATVHTAAVRSEVPHTGESADLPGLQQAWTGVRTGVRLQFIDFIGLSLGSNFYVSIFFGRFPVSLNARSTYGMCVLLSMQTKLQHECNRSGRNPKKQFMRVAASGRSSNPAADHLARVVCGHVQRRFGFRMKTKTMEG